ncbi:hypothetical protein [Adhaeretor mobilis]|uniref:Uncharacterized protein n=1 Tax=Adhaeretor mobilis TaxID=1930276 RepID=A0A517N1V5_9BACT|nr:hypothetical protein [Adhaeretor mobilis]QDT01117.1 hypothetical protein HG15A2_44590 [Adhaeretor mobilis]
MNLRVIMLAVTTTLILTLAVSPSAAATQPVASFADIQFWIGSGTNRTALAIDFNGQTPTDEALVWGYRWDGTATGSDLFQEVVAADSQLFAKLVAIPPEGEAIIGIGYDANNDQQFAITGGATFDELGIFHSPSVSDAETSLDEQDLYAEGWFLGYWHLGTQADDPAGTWSSSQTSIGALPLVDGSYVGLAFTTDTESTGAFPENLVSAALPQLSSGDFNGDHLVDGLDFSIWQTGLADSTSLTAWQAHYGQAKNRVLAVPEPSSGILALTMLVVTVSTRHRTPKRTSH